MYGLPLRYRYQWPAGIGELLKAIKLAYKFNQLMGSVTAVRTYSVGACFQGLRALTVGGPQL